MRRAVGTIAVIIALTLPSGVEASSGPGLLRGTPPAGYSETKWTDGDAKTCAALPWYKHLTWQLPTITEVRRVWYVGDTYWPKLQLLDSTGRVLYETKTSSSSPVSITPVPGVAVVKVYNGWYGTVCEVDVWGPQAPEPPVDLTAAQTGPGEVTLRWQPGDDLAVTWRVYRDGQLTAEVPAGVTQYTVTGLAVGTHKFGISGVESGGAEGAKAEVTVQVADITPPAPPTQLRAVPTQSSVSLSWQPVQDSDLEYYRVYQGDQLIGTTSGTNYTVSRLDPDTAYVFGVSSVDKAGNESARATVQARTMATSPLASKVELRWTELPAYVLEAVRISGPVWLLTAGLLIGGGSLERMLAWLSRLRR